MRVQTLGKNKTVIGTTQHRIFVSYETPVAYQDLRTGEYFVTAQRWSNTTTRHVKEWLAGAGAKVLPQDHFDKLLDLVSPEVK